MWIQQKNEWPKCKETFEKYVFRWYIYWNQISWVYIAKIQKRKTIYCYSGGKKHKQTVCIALQKERKLESFFEMNTERQIRQTRAFVLPARGSSSYDETFYFCIFIFSLLRVGKRFAPLAIFFYIFMSQEFEHDGRTAIKLIIKGTLGKSLNAFHPFASLYFC